MAKYMPITGGANECSSSLTGGGDQDIEDFIDALVRYNCIGRDYSVGCSKIVQYLRDDVFQGDLGGSTSLIGTGSGWEGMPRMVCGDKDFMLVKSSWPIVAVDQHELRSNPSLDKGQGQVTAQANKMQPAFLVLCNTTNTGSIPASMFVDWYLSSEMFVTEFNADRTERHGPAHASAAFPTVPGKLMRDLVPCLKSPQWPPCAMEFYSRERLHGWPSPQVISEIKTGGCHVVGKAAPGTHHPEIDFRWSFSVAEKSLCHDMNEKMADCMYLLKSIKKKEWPENSGICSFYFKTACFWTFEENKASASVLVLTDRVLDWLIQHYNDRSIPNYFIPDQNLIFGLSAEICDTIIALLAEIKRDLPLKALCSMKVEKSVVDMAKSMSKDKHIAIELAHESDGKELFSLLLNHGGSSILREVRKSILPKGLLYTKKVLSSFVWELMAIELDTYNTIQAEIPEDGFLSPGWPEAILEPTLLNYAPLVPPDMIKPIETTIHRVIGDVYLKCLEKIKGDCADLKSRDPVYGVFVKDTQHPGVDMNENQQAEEIKILAKSYFERARVPIQSPDGTTDAGFQGAVNLAKFYYTTEQSEEFKVMVKQLKHYLKQEPVGEWGLNVVKGLTKLTNEILMVISKPSSDGILKTLTKDMYPGSFLTSECVAWLFCVISARRKNSKFGQLRAALGLMRGMVYWLNSWYYMGDESDQAIIKAVVQDMREMVPREWKQFLEKKGFSRLAFLDKGHVEARQSLLTRCCCLCCIIPM